MRHFLTSLALLATLAAAGQTEWSYPYNPDADADGAIGINDLLELLPLFGGYFNVGDGIYLNSDTTNAVVLTASSSDYLDCSASCRALGSTWRVLTWEDYVRQADAISGISEDGYLEYAWLRTDEHLMPSGSTYLLSSASLLYVRSNESDQYKQGRRQPVTSPNDNYYAQCWCATSLLKEIEYDVCYVVYGNQDGSFQSCINEKLQSGWSLLGGTSIGGNSPALVQGFWRYSD